MNHVHFRGSMRPGSLRFARSLSEAFPSERDNVIEHFVSNKPRHKFTRFVRRLVRYMLGARA